MKEEFLYYVWQHKMFSNVNLRTLNSEEIYIVKSGIHNKNTGPDFLNSQVKIDKQLWFGHTEMHVKSSDWYAHRHEEDVNYDAVILGVNHDIFIKQGHLKIKKYGKENHVFFDLKSAFSEADSDGRL